MLHDDHFGTGTPSRIKCPITGSDLIYDGYEYEVRDGDSYYHSEADSSLKWEKNMRSFYYELVHPEERWMSSREIIEARRYFKIEENGEWQEYFAKISTPATRLFPVGTSMIDVDRILQLDIEDKKQRDEEYKRKVASGEIDPLAFPTITAKIDAKTIAYDLAEVKPMPEPLGVLLYMDFKIKESQEYLEPQSQYPYTVSEENLEALRKEWKKDDIQIGDQVTYWDKGGWGSLSGRAGEHIRRDGKIIHTRLTRMS
jgi:hypothetical protein